MSKNPNDCPSCGLPKLMCKCAGAEGAEPVEPEQGNENDANKNNNAQHQAVGPAAPAVVTPSCASGINLPPVESVIPDRTPDTTRKSVSNTTGKPDDDNEHREGECREFNTPFNTGIPKARPNGE